MVTIPLEDIINLILGVVVGLLITGFICYVFFVVIYHCLGDYLALLAQLAKRDQGQQNKQSHTQANQDDGAKTANQRV